MTTVLPARGVRRTDRGAAHPIYRAELAIWPELLRSLQTQDWSRPTVCDRWNVKDLVAHLVAQAEDIALPWSFPLRDRRAHRRFPDLSPLNGHMEAGVVEHRAKTPENLVRAFDRWWAAALRSRRLLPGPMRRMPLSGPAKGMTLAYLHDVIYVRDLWMHRDDLCRAVDRPFVPGEHAAALLSQVLLDLDTAWKGPPLRLELTGGPTGDWTIGEGAPVATARLDAVTFLRSLSGRGPGPVIELEPDDGRARHALREARVLF